jgi:hypothetical protein
LYQFLRNLLNAELSREDKQFNFLHARARVNSEHCIGILKARFQCLKELRVPVRDRTSVAHVNAWVKLCCVLHNFLLDIKDGIDDNWERPLISRQDSVESSDPVNINNGQSSSNCRIVVNENLPLNEARNGIEKRLILKRILEATF